MSRAQAILIGSLLAAVIGLQVVQERQPTLSLPADASGNLLYVRSPDVVRRMALSYDAVAAGEVVVQEHDSFHVVRKEAA